MLLTSNVNLLNAVLLLNDGLPKDLQVSVLHYNFLTQKYKSHRIMYVISIAVTALPCNVNFLLCFPEITGNLIKFFLILT